MEKPKLIIVSGSIAIDRIMSFSGRYKEIIRPEQLEKLSVSVLLDNLNDSRGGIGANIVYTMALLGESPILLGSVGKDAASYMERLAGVGVITTAVHTSDLSTASFSVITDSDENQVAGFYPGAMFDSQSLSLHQWKDQDPLVMISAHDPAGMARQVAECRQWNLKFCYDVGQQVTNLPVADMVEGIKDASMLFVNEYEMTTLAARTGLEIDEIKAAVPIVITTFGKQGSIIEGADVKEPIQVGIANAAQVTDPTGAGDSYRAGFIYGYSRGWKLLACGQLGATCASYSIEQTGTQNHSFDFETVAKRYQEQFNQPVPRAESPAN